MYGFAIMVTVSADTAVVILPMANTTGPAIATNPAMPKMIAFVSGFISRKPSVMAVSRPTILFTAGTMISPNETARSFMRC